MKPFCGVMTCDVSLNLRSFYAVICAKNGSCNIRVDAVPLQVDSGIESNIKLQILDLHRFRETHVRLRVTMGGLWPGNIPKM